MYSVVLMMALTTGGDASMSRHHGGGGCCGQAASSGCDVRRLRRFRRLFVLRHLLRSGRLLVLRRRRLRVCSAGDGRGHHRRVSARRRQADL
jgi:hypothetical protein